MSGKSMIWNESFIFLNWINKCKNNERCKQKYMHYTHTHTHSHTYMCVCVYVSKSKVGDHSRGSPEGSPFNSYYNDV